jgi:hypothetical protein
LTGDASHADHIKEPLGFLYQRREGLKTAVVVSWKFELTGGDALLANESFITLGDHVGLNLLGGVDSDTNQDQK